MPAAFQAMACAQKTWPGELGNEAVSGGGRDFFDRDRYSAASLVGLPTSGGCASLGAAEAQVCAAGIELVVGGGGGGARMGREREGVPCGMRGERFASPLDLAMIFASQPFSLQLVSVLAPPPRWPARWIPRYITGTVIAVVVGGPAGFLTEKPPHPVPPAALMGLVMPASGRHNEPPESPAARETPRDRASEFT